MTRTALPTTSAGRFWPFGPLGIRTPHLRLHAQSVKRLPDGFLIKELARTRKSERAQFML